VKNAERFEVDRVLPDGTRCSLHQMLYTAAILVGISENGLIYERRYCYEHWDLAQAALLQWDGAGDPPGPWVKEKPSDRLGPGATGG